MTEGRKSSGFSVDSNVFLTIVRGGFRLRKPETREPGVGGRVIAETRLPVQYIRAESENDALSREGLFEVRGLVTCRRGGLESRPARMHRRNYMCLCEWNAARTSWTDLSTWGANIQ